MKRNDSLMAMIKEITEQEELRKAYFPEGYKEVPILIPKNFLRWSPISNKLKWLQKSMRELAMELKKEQSRDD